MKKEVVVILWHSLAFEKHISRAAALHASTADGGPWCHSLSYEARFLRVTSCTLVNPCQAARLSADELGPVSPFRPLGCGFQGKLQRTEDRTALSHRNEGRETSGLRELQV